MPATFVAVTVHWYGYWLANPVTTIGLAEPVADLVGWESNDTHVAVYLVIGAPPSNPGVNPTEMPAIPAEVTDTSVGASGTAAGTVAVVIRPIDWSPMLSNHNAPSGPAVMPSGSEMPGSL